MMRRALITACTSLMSLAAVGSAHAEGTRFYNLEGFGNFLDGNPESTAVTEDGVITLPPLARERFADAAAVFSAATAKGDDIIVARVKDGQILAIDRAGKTREVAKLNETLVTALLDTDAGLLVAAGPPGKIYKVDAKGKAQVFYTGEAGYIWAMTAGPKGSIYAVTGEPGTVIKVDASGKGTKLFESGQTHLRSLAYAPSLGLFIGGGERGVLYRSSNEKDFRALYDSGHPEITAVVAHGSYAYAAGVSGAEALASEEGTSDGKRGKGAKSAPTVRSQLVRVAMDGSAETLAGSNDEAIFAMGLDGDGRVLVATGATGRDEPRGRLYAVETQKRQIAMLYQAPSRRITHLVPLPRGAFAAVAAAGGRIVHFSGGKAQKGEFFTVPIDTGINSSFGALQIYGSWPQGSKVTASMRSGQTATPDETWSAWSKEIPAPGGVSAGAPNGRYAQVRLTFTSDGKASPMVHRVRFAYLRQNLAPFVREVVALRKGVALMPIPREEQKSKTVSLADKASEDARRGDDDSRGGASPGRARQVEQRGAQTVRWVAEDPNGDDLRYDLEVRSLGRGEWRRLGEKMVEPFFTLQSAQLPDGHYQFRVRASDAPSNPDGAELSDSRESLSVLIDNSAPRIDSASVSVDGRRVTARVVVVDTVGPIVSAEYALDGGEFRPMAPDDGVLDGAGETFTLRLGALDAGAHTLTIRVVDEAENEGFGETSFSIP